MERDRGNLSKGCCLCGCGLKTKLHPQNHTTLGWSKGEPKDYINGHNPLVYGAPVGLKKN